MQKKEHLDQSNNKWQLNLQKQLRIFLQYLQYCSNYKQWLDIFLNSNSVCNSYL